MSTVAFDIEAVRRRFSALNQPLAFFDGPGGTQVPDEVIDAIGGYLRTSNANVSGPYETSRRTEELVVRARETASRFLTADPDELAFGQNMTTLNFAWTRTAAREWAEGDEVIVTKLDHDANVSPWLELAHDKGLVVHFADINEDCTLDLDDLQRLLSDRTRVVAFPVASNAVGTVSDPRRIAELAHETGALAWADAVHYGPHGPIDVAGWDVDVLICSPYKFFGPHLGLAWGKRALLESWRPYKVRPASMEPLGHRFETGTLPHEQLAGFVAAVEYLDSIGWDAIRSHERELGQRFLGGTLFVGRAVVEAAAGHEVTLLNRGETNPELFSGVEKLRGDRTGELEALRGRSFDACIDVNARESEWVRRSLEGVDAPYYLF